MTIAFTGGGTGGHFYPLIAIAEAINDIAKQERFLDPKLYYLAPAPFDRQALFENEIEYIRIPAGKMRRYFSLRNLSDTFLTISGFFAALGVLYRLYPDVLISKGGYGSVPATLAARVLGIPLIIHESDAKPGRANLMASRWAEKIAIAFDSAGGYFPKSAQKKIARTGIPIRKELTTLEPEGAREYLHLDADVPTVLILGGSSGSVRINETVLAALPELVENVNVIHQCGKANFEEARALAKVELAKSAHTERYHPFDYLDVLTLRRSAAAADLIVSRAGASAIAEVALWAKPALIIPIPEVVSHDQRTNAYAYAATGAAVVLEEANLTPHLLFAEIARVVGNKQLSVQMGKAAANFIDPDAANILAREALAIGLSHEPAKS